MVNPNESEPSSGQDAFSYLIEALAQCVLSQRLSGSHRHWACEQLLKCLTYRAALSRGMNPESFNSFSDYSHAFPRSAFLQQVYSELPNLPMFKALLTHLPSLMSVRCDFEFRLCPFYN